MHTFENLNIVLTPTPAWTDADANDWVTTKALQGHSPDELKNRMLSSTVLNGLI